MARDAERTDHWALATAGRECDFDFLCVLRRRAAQRRPVMNPQDNIVAGIDVHKRILVVVVLHSSEPDRDHATARFGTTALAGGRSHCQLRARPRATRVATSQPHSGGHVGKCSASEKPNRSPAGAGADQVIFSRQRCAGPERRRILHALLEGVHDPVQLAALAHYRIHTSEEDLADALSGRITS